MLHPEGIICFSLSGKAGRIEQYKIKVWCSEVQTIISTELTGKVIEITVIFLDSGWTKFLLILHNNYFDILISVKMSAQTREYDKMKTFSIQEVKFTLQNNFSASQMQSSLCISPVSLSVVI